jgi:hypothetical protein
MEFGRIVSGLITTLVMGCLASASIAQSEFVVRTQQGGQRQFAEPLFWLNMTPDNRLPIRERLLIPQGGLTAMAPPSSQRAGLTPWIGLAFEVNDSGTSGDSVLTFSPGMRYSLVTPRLTFEAEYALETGLHLQRSDLSRIIQGHGGYANLSFALDNRSQLSFGNFFSDSRDLRNAPVQGVLAPDARLISNRSVLNYRYSPSRRSLLDVTWTNGQNWIQSPGAVDISENTLSTRYKYALTEITSLESTASAGWYDLGTKGGASRLSADVSLIRDFGQRLAFSGTLGMIHTSEDGGQTLPNIGVSLIHTDRFARYSLSAVRDIIAVPGLSDLAHSDEVKGQALLRLDRGLILDVSMGLQRLSVYDAAGTDVLVATASGKLSYAVRDNFWVWAQVELKQERSGGITQTDNRLIVGLSRSLD